MGKSAKPRALADNEAKAVLRNLRVSPQKLNLVDARISDCECREQPFFGC